MKILIACEFSGIVREEFRKRGHDAMSCDLLPTEIPGNHYQGDVMDIINDGWNMMIAHPPCTYLSVSGAQYWKARQTEQEKAIEFFLKLFTCNIPKVAIENPVGIMSTVFRKPDQYIQPYEHGHKISKKPGLWLKDLPLITPTNIVEPEWVYYKNGGRCSPDHYKNAFAKDRGKKRSKTYSGIAKAMSSQWKQ